MRSMNAGIQMKVIFVDYRLHICILYSIIECRMHHSPAYQMLRSEYGNACWLSSSHDEADEIVQLITSYDYY